jgi:hydroxymethylpyrimidine/phosphomethylpyrimidine kinase
VAAVKIGQVPTAALARLLARRLDRLGVPVVLDPVLRASGGGSLVAASASRAIVSSLVPRAHLVTVNLSEAAALARIRVSDVSGMRRAAAALEALGAHAVLVKGGHLASAPVDLLREGAEETTFRGTRLRGSMHGTGCALASAIAARIACGDDLGDAVKRGREHVRGLLRGAVEIGKRRLRAAESY